MWTIETGNTFLGYTDERLCEHCHNITLHVVRQDYVKQSLLYFVPIGTTTGRVYISCPICEKEATLLKSQLFAGADAIAIAIKHLESGKLHTKAQISRYPIEEKEKLYKRLNKLGAHSLVRFLAS